MKKKLTKIIGSILLSSMVLASVCPLSALAAEEPATEPNMTDAQAVVQQEQQLEQIAQTENEAIVTGAQTSVETLKNEPSDDPDALTVEDASENKEETEAEKVPQTDDSEADTDGAITDTSEDTAEEPAKEPVKEAAETDPSPAFAKTNAQGMEVKAAAETAQQNRIELKITNNTGMFNAVTAYVETKDGKSELVMALNGTGYQYLFLGTYEEASAVGYDLSAWIEGIEDENGKLAFRIPLEDGRTYYPLV
ncbi:MAG: hypothetical protein J5483_02725, partial [Lachnospiraceae bacterium]|nr:hypothetical protein [Lachnospiraceae bacterium]